jgi:hypothetical protein
MTPLQQLEEQLREIDNDPGVRTFRSLNKRRRPDLSNTSDTDVLGWMQDASTNLQEFYDEYAQHRTCSGYDEYASEFVDLLKRVVIIVQDMRGRQEEIDGIE